MRALPLVVALLLAPLAAANHATYLDESKVMGCLALASAGGVTGALNCGLTREVAAAEPAGGQYRLTVAWSGSADFAQLFVDLQSCSGPCPTTGVCVNNVCQGSGPSLVQQATAQGTSPLVLTIPTAGAEDRVQVSVRPPGPAFASLGSASVHLVLQHTG